jgi:hypothetical protein
VTPTPTYPICTLDDTDGTDDTGGTDDATGPVLTADEQIQAAAEWIWSRAGGTAANWILHDYRTDCYAPTPPEIDDLRADALARFVVRVLRHGPIDPFEPARYLDTVMRNIRRDYYRGRSARVVEIVGLDEDIADHVPMISCDPAAGVPVEWRVAIESANRSAADRAAALAYLTIVGHPGVVPDGLGAPMPTRGATDEETARWHALWFSGRRDGLFPDEHCDPPARRKARSRAGRAVRDLVERAIATVRTSNEEHDD